MDWTAQYAIRTRQMTSSAIRELLKLCEQPDFISFAGGLPAPEVFPVEAVAEVSARILRESGAQALQYGATEGYRPLRALLAEELSADGPAVGIDNVLITTGSQQAIDLIGKIFINRGDAVVVESPTYLAALQSWNAYGARYLSVDADEHGMETDHLEALMAERPKLVYCLPNFQNPSGVTLSAERRAQLIEIARRHEVIVVEDDPYREVRFEGEHLPRLITLAGGDGEYNGEVISLGTFSKILSPGLRVGWVIAAAPVIRQLVQAKQGADLHTATFNQMIAYELLRSGELADHRRVIVDTYRARRDVMLAALEESFPPGTAWTHPEGGMFLWVTLPEGIDAAAVLDHCVSEQVAFVPGQAFHADGSGANTMRLNFSNAAPEQIRDGIERLGRAIRRFLARQRVA
jgi:2-aminoadipate transaminase